MSEIPVQFILAAFNDEKTASDTLRTLKMAKWGRLIGIQNAAVVRRDEKNKIHIKEMGDPGGGKGATFGAIAGGIIGLLAGPAGVVIGGAAGAAVGGITAKVVDSGIPNDRLKELGKALKPGTSAIVAIIEHKWVAELEQELAQAGADVMTEALKQDIARQLEAGEDVVYTAIAGEGGVAAGKASGTEDAINIEGIVATEQGVAAVAGTITAEDTGEADSVASDGGEAEGNPEKPAE
ncbi:MAG: DUF1269 domain-containing protein [Chloroflexi bacterium]|nr:MAG: DUF1269 domain-containing protein [Chloroflexota bacterium]